METIENKALKRIYRKDLTISFISIIIPCRNEEGFIAKCLDSIIDSEYPKTKIEILVIDGMSEDKTREIIKEYTQRYPLIRVLENPKKIIPAALNIGIKNAKGEIIIRMDAHNVYSKDYISKCVKYLNESNVDNVGGILVTLPGNNTIVAESIALALSHPFGVGNAYYRIGVKEPKFVDTVPFGCYKREIFNIIGLFDEDLIRNEDDEFNLRLIKNGCKILLVPSIVSYYYARDSLLKLWRMFFQYGYFKPLVAKKANALFTCRQLIPALFVSSLIIFAILSFLSKVFLTLFLFCFFCYLIVNISFTLIIALKKGLKHLLILPIVFGSIHISYGWGYLKGIWDFALFEKHKKIKTRDIPLTR